jgi:hypothetical protein
MAVNKHFHSPGLAAATASQLVLGGGARTWQLRNLYMLT